MSEISENSLKKKRGRPRKIEIADVSVRESRESPGTSLLAVRLAADQPAKRGLGGRQKRPRPTTKKQVTVRIDEQLLETVRQRASRQGMDLTSAVEEGLWLYLGEERAEATIQLRFLVSALPLATQKRLLSAAQYMISKELAPHEERLRAFMSQIFDLFAQDPRAQHALVEFTQLEA